MRNIITGLLLLLIFATAGTAQERPSKYTIAFYNLENLFDTINTPEVMDEEFTPEGPKAWNTAKYNKKMSNIEKVFYGIATEAKGYPAVIGVSEIENRNVLEDVVALDKLQRANYQIVHYDSPDRRGVDVAFLYNPSMFTLEGSLELPIIFEDKPDWKTRGIVMMWGTIEGEPFYFLVGHWPSRIGGQAASESKRMKAAEVMRMAVDSVQKIRPDAKIVLMGDFNDDPSDKSIAVTLGAKAKASDVTSGQLFNPYYEMHKKGFGTLAYNDQMNLFDNIVVNETLLNGSAGELRIVKPSNSKFYGNIYDRPFLRQQSGQFKGYPLRTFVGNTFQGGFSDHFPVFIYIAR